MSEKDKIYGVTHRGTDAETEAFMENGRVWIRDESSHFGWLLCWMGTESYFTKAIPGSNPVEK